MNFKNKKLWLIIGATLVIILTIVLLFTFNKESAEAEKEPVLIKIHDYNVSLNSLIEALEGEIIKENKKFTFMVEEKEIIVEEGNEIIVVDKEEVTIKDPVNTESNFKPYVDEKEEIYVPIPFVEEELDVKYDEETQEFTKDDEVLGTGNNIEIEIQPEEPKIEEESEEEAVVTPEEELEEEAQTKPEEPKVEEEPKEEPVVTPEEKPQTKPGDSNNNNSNSGVITPTPEPESKPEAPVVNATSVGVSQTWIDLEVGGSVKVSAWVSPENVTNKGITWSSENNSVATVDSSGNIVAKGAGYTRIVATAVSNGNAKAYIEINVTEKVVVPTPTPEPTPTPTPEPTPEPTPSAVRGDSVVSQLLNEGFFSGSGGAFWHPEGDSVATEFQDVYAVAYNGGMSLQVAVAGYYGEESYSKAHQVLSKILPNSASTVVGYIKNGQAGSYTLDGRKVSISFGSKAFIYID